MLELPPQLLGDIAAAHTSLRHLAVPGCGLQALPPQVWALRHLRHLDLSRNQLQALPDVGAQPLGAPGAGGSGPAAGGAGSGAEPSQPGACAPGPQLTSLDLRDNANLHSLCGGLGALSGLVELRLGGTSVRALPPSAAQLSALKVRGPAASRGGSGLHGVRCCRGAPLRWPVPTPLPRPPQVLDLSHTGVAADPGALPPGMASVEDLSLEHCRLGQLPAGLEGWLGLTRLALGDNQLAALPCWLGGLRGLRVLDLRNNRLGEAPAQLAGLEVRWAGPLRTCAALCWHGGGGLAALTGPPALPRAGAAAAGPVWAAGGARGAGPAGPHAAAGALEGSAVRPGAGRGDAARRGAARFGRQPAGSGSAPGATYTAAPAAVRTAAPPARRCWTCRPGCWRCRTCAASRWTRTRTARPRCWSSCGGGVSSCRCLGEFARRPGAKGRPGALQHVGCVLTVRSASSRRHPRKQAVLTNNRNCGDARPPIAPSASASVASGLPLIARPRQQRTHRPRASPARVMQRLAHRATSG
jgi:hypothetical protein